jgi:serine/threonine protein kinase
MERAETSLDTLAYDMNRAGHRVPVVEAIKVMIQALQAIERIHVKGVVHGDIHWGNLVLLNRNGHQDLRLIDFGNAMFADEMELLPAIVRVPGSYNHCYFSHWNLAGYRFAYRDDVFKALMVGAFLINGPKYSEYCVGLESDIQAMMAFKRDSFLFALPNRDHIAELPIDSDTKRIVRQRLSNALVLARTPRHVDDLPNYGGIVDELSAAVDALQAAQS